MWIKRGLIGSAASIAATGFGAGEVPIDAPEAQVVVCQIDPNALKNSKLRELARGHERAINKPLPLVPVPPLSAARKQLLGASKNSRLSQFVRV